MLDNHLAGGKLHGRGDFRGLIPNELWVEGAQLPLNTIGAETRDYIVLVHQVDQAIGQGFQAPEDPGTAAAAGPYDIFVDRHVGEDHHRDEEGALAGGLADGVSGCFFCRPIGNARVELSGRTGPNISLRQISLSPYETGSKGRVERKAETFQDRLVTELRLADARTIDQTTAVLQDFLPRFNARFAVQPEHLEAAYRPVATDRCLSETLCFKHTRKVARDNTVKYHWRVLQLLPDRERPSYAGLRVEVLERPDGELIVQYQGHSVAMQEPPPRMGAVWLQSAPGRPALNSNASSAA